MVDPKHDCRPVEWGPRYLYLNLAESEKIPKKEFVIQNTSCVVVKCLMEDFYAIGEVARRGRGLDPTALG